MRRSFSQVQPPEALQQFQLMQEEALGLKLLLPYLPKGAGMEDAKTLHERLSQTSRTPCRFLDERLGIRRD
jgi:hypothetical protein